MHWIRRNDDLAKEALISRSARSREVPWGFAEIRKRTRICNNRMGSCCVERVQAFAALENEEKLVFLHLKRIATMQSAVSK